MFVHLKKFCNTKKEIFSTQNNFRTDNFFFENLKKKPCCKMFWLKTLDGGEMQIKFTHNVLINVRFPSNYNEYYFRLRTPQKLLYPCRMHFTIFWFAVKRAANRCRLYFVLDRSVNRDAAAPFLTTVDWYGACLGVGLIILQGGRTKTNYVKMKGPPYWTKKTI